MWPRNDTKLACWPRRAIRQIQRPLGSHLLDDGFQHRQLHRDVDILLLNRADWRDSLLPAGNLREPLQAATPRHRASRFRPTSRNWRRIFAPGVGRALSGGCTAAWRFPPVDGPVAAFCGIARPEQFFAGLEAAGLRVAARIAFPDHYRYTDADLKRLLGAARTAGAAALITTGERRVRLGSLAPAFPANLPLKTAAPAH